MVIPAVLYPLSVIALHYESCYDPPICILERCGSLHSYNSFPSLVTR